VTAGVLVVRPLVDGSEFGYTNAEMVRNVPKLRSSAHFEDEAGRYLIEVDGSGSPRS
jgi:hypothetical protein